MRLSVREDDPGYSPQATFRCKVFVDDVEVTTRCHTADEEQGKAWCFKLNELGEKFRDGDRAAEEVLTGKVVIILPKDEVNGHDTHPCN